MKIIWSTSAYVFPLITDSRWSGLQESLHPILCIPRLQVQPPQKQNSWNVSIRFGYGHADKALFDGNTQRSLIINDLKLGDETTSQISLWVDVCTAGYFSDLKVTSTHLDFNNHYYETASPYYYFKELKIIKRWLHSKYFPEAKDLASWAYSWDFFSNYYFYRSAWELQNNLVWKVNFELKKPISFKLWGSYKTILILLNNFIKDTVFNLKKHY